MVAVCNHGGKNTMYRHEIFKKNSCQLIHVKTSDFVGYFRRLREKY